MLRTAKCDYGAAQLLPPCLMCLEAFVCGLNAQHIVNAHVPSKCQGQGNALCPSCAASARFFYIASVIVVAAVACGFEFPVIFFGKSKSMTEAQQFTQRQLVESHIYCRTVEQVRQLCS